MTREEMEDLIKQAEMRNSARDGWERHAGFAAPQDTPVFAQARTVMSALECAMQMNDWGNVAEAYCLVRDIAAAMKPELSPC